MGLVQVKLYNPKYFTDSHSKGIQINASLAKKEIFLDTCVNLHYTKWAVTALLTRLLANQDLDNFLQQVSPLPRKQNVFIYLATPIFLKEKKFRFCSTSSI